MGNRPLLSQVLFLNLGYNGHKIHLGDVQGQGLIHPLRVSVLYGDDGDELKAQDDAVSR